MHSQSPRFESHNHVFVFYFTVRVDLSLVTFNWFLTVFVDNFPVQVCTSSHYRNAVEPIYNEVPRDLGPLDCVRFAGISL